MGASSARKLDYGGKGRRAKNRARFGCWISPCYGLVSLGGRFETYEPFISLILQFCSGRGEQRITETVDTRARLYSSPNILGR
jgi:hypothetical protein